MLKSGGCVSCKPPGMFAVVHPEQACASSPPSGSGQVFFTESSSRVFSVRQRWTSCSSRTQCPLWFSLSHPVPLGIDAFVLPWLVLRLYAFPLVKLIPAALCRVRECGIRLLVLAILDVVLTVHFPGGANPVGDSYQDRPASQFQGRILHPHPRT